MPNADPNALHVVIDTETTGIDPKIERIKAIAGAGGTLRDGVTRAFKLYVDAGGRRSGAEAMAIHRIPDDVGGTMAEREALLVMIAMVGDGKVVIQNKSFDVGFLVAACERHQVALPAWLRDGGAAVVDTIDMARERFPRNQMNLDNLGRLLNVDPALLKRREAKHDALEDCELTFQVWSLLSTRDTLDLSVGKAAAKAVDASQVDQATNVADWL